MSVIIKHKGKNNSKIHQILVNNKKLMTPTYFPSISGAEIRSEPLDLINVIIDEEYPRLLVSCYDVDKLTIELKDTTIKKLNNYSTNGGFLMLDSGEFERYYLKFAEWTIDKYQKMIRRITADFFFGFDKIPNMETKYDEMLKTATDNFSFSNSLVLNNHCITILHGQNIEEICMLTEHMVKNYADLQFIAITDKECGKTLQEQCMTVSLIRKICDDKEKDIIIHVLGCGNPLSIAALSYAGADIFDAVDWSRWVVDNKTWQCGNLSHIKLLDCSCIACCDEKAKNERIRAFQHNLIFYQDFIARLQNAISQDYDVTSFLKNENIDQNVIEILAKLF